MAKLELRKITVNGATFFWSADWTYIRVGEEVYNVQRTIHLRIWGDDKRSQPLDVDLHGPRWDDRTYVLPHQVRAVIEYGLAHGWDPTTIKWGEPYWLTGAAALVLGNLVPTDHVINQ